MRRDFTEWVWKDNVAEIARQGIKVVTNAGGISPRRCRERMEEIAAEAGVSLKIAIVEGDDIRDMMPEIESRGITEMYSGEAFRGPTGSPAPMPIWAGAPLPMPSPPGPMW